VISRLRQRFREDLPFQIIFDSPTVAKLAEVIDSAGDVKAVAVDETREELEI
jgi:hypothetical protein